jgi:hypothetical protein
VALNDPLVAHQVELDPLGQRLVVPHDLLKGRGGQDLRHQRRCDPDGLRDAPLENGREFADGLMGRQRVRHGAAGTGLGFADVDQVDAILLFAFMRKDRARLVVFDGHPHGEPSPDLNLILT